MSPTNIADVSAMNIADIGSAWEGRLVDARLPLRQWLGSSDHSSVYLTEVAGPASPKAVVKIFPADFFQLEPQVARWRKLAQLNCPSLLRLLDGGRAEIDGTAFFYVVTDFADENLAQILPQRALTADEVKDLLPPLLQGLAYLHHSGFVHGHVQPSNIMAAEDKLKLPVERLSAVGEPPNHAVIGPYDAPEIATGVMTPAADVWSLGMFLAAALTQHPLPFDGHVAPKIPGGIAQPLRGIIGDCLVVDPKKRCTIAEIAARLDLPPLPLPKPAPVAIPAPVAKPASASLTAPLRIVEVPETPVSKPAAAGRSAVPRSLVLRSLLPPGWRTVAPIAAVALILVLIVGQRIISHRHQVAATSAPTAADALPPEGAVLLRVIPNVPASKRRTIQGQIQVSVQINLDASGKIIATKVVSPGPSKYLSDLALETAQQWRFSPAQNNGAPVPSAWQIRFQFGRRTTQVFPKRITQ